MGLLEVFDCLEAGGTAGTVNIAYDVMLVELELYPLDIFTLHPILNGSGGNRIGIGLGIIGVLYNQSTRTGGFIGRTASGAGGGLLLQEEPPSESGGSLRAKENRQQKIPHRRQPPMSLTLERPDGHSGHVRHMLIIALSGERSKRFSPLWRVFRTFRTFFRATRQCGWSVVQSCNR